MSNIINISQILIKRGNTTAANSYVGPLGELVVDTGLKTLRLQDGSTPGGMATLVNSQQFANLSATVANISANAGAYGNANVAAYLPIYGGAVGTSLINFTNSNAQIESGETAGQPNSSWIEMTANIQHDIAGFYAAENGSAQVYSAQDVLLYSNTLGTAPLWTFDRTGNLNLPSTTGRILFPYNDNSNAILDNSQDLGQYFIIQNNFADGYQGINLNTDDAQVTISSKNTGGYPLRTWNFDWQGQLTYPDNTVQTSAYQGPAGQTSFATVANVTTANTALKGYVDNQITLLVNSAPAILDTLGQIATAIQNDEGNISTILTNITATNANIAAANAAIITANTAMKGYVDAVTTAWTANAATQQGLIATLQSNAATQESEITSINANITAANLAITALQSNAATQEGEVTGLRSNIIAANSAITALQANVGSFYTYANLNYGTSSYANANVAAYFTSGASGNIKTTANVIATTFMFANGVNILSTVAASSTYSNANVVANLQNYATAISSTANIATTANMIAPNYLFANGVNILSTIAPSSSYSNTNVAAYLTTQTFYSNTNTAAYLTTATVTTTGNITAGNLTTSGTYTVANITTTGAYGNITGANVISANTVQASSFNYANGVNILTGIGGTYSNTNVAAYLTTQTFYSNSNVASYLVANPQGNTYSNANVVANLANYVTNIVSTANITANYFVGNGAALSGVNYASIGNIYGSSSNVTLQAGSYSWTFDNTGNLTIPTTGNIIYANGTVFTSGTGSSGGTLYTNANVVSMLAANSIVVLGNANPYPTQSNITQLFVGGNTTITSGGGSSAAQTQILNNAYFGSNGAMYTRNTYSGGAGQFYIDGANFYWNAQGTATANAVAGMGSRMSLTSTLLSTINSVGISSAGLITASAGLAVNSATGITTNQASIPLVNTTATTINFGGAATTLTMGAATGTVTVAGNLFAGNNLGVNTGNLSVRAQGNWNVLTVYGVAGGYNSPPYTNQALTGGSGTGMTANYSSTGGYISTITVNNPGTGYKNGDILTVPGGLGSTVILSQYNSAIAGTLGGASSFTFTMDGSLLLPGNVSHATNTFIYGDFTNSTVNYRTIFAPLAANSNPGIYAAPSGTGTAASWQAANSSNIANASKILIATNGTTDVQLVSGINGTGTYLPMSFYTNGSNQMQLGTGGNLLMVTGGNIATSGNVIAGNIIANQYGNSIGTTATYSGNITASSVIASGSSGPQTRFLWDTWQANSTSALSSFTPSGTIGGNAAWDSTQAYGLKLTTTTTTQSGYINWNSSTINYNYDMVITASIAASGGTGADGQWIYFGSNAAITGIPGNTNTYGGIAVMNHYYSSASQFEIYVNSTQTNIPYIGNGNYVTSGVTLWNASYTSFYNLTLKIRKIQNGNRMLEVYLNEIYQGSVNIGSWTPVGNYFGVAAYTGGSTAQNWVRQLRIDW